MPDEVNKIHSLEQRIAAMRIYLQVKVDMWDWHGVADAAMDLREMEAELKTRKEFGSIPLT